MAELIHSPTGGGPVNAFEQQVVKQLVSALPSGYAVIPNFSLRDQQGRGYEYDAVVLAPHAIYVLEAKEWYGRLTGDDTEWLLNGKPRKCPLWLADQKGKVLKARTGIAHGLWVEPLLVVPDGIRNDLGGNWSGSLVPISRLADVVSDPYSVKYPSQTALPHTQIQYALLGQWFARKQGDKRRFGSYEVVETITQDGDSGEYLAHHAVLGGDDQFRVRTWTLVPYLYGDPDARLRREAVIKRPAEALQRIGRHPNLLPVLAFDYDEDSNEFYEVTEWSAFGTLHGYLRHRDREQQLTIRERLEIAAGVASALEAVHAHGLVHRNVCPETIVIDFDRQPRLTDFDRAYIDRSVTVFPATSHRRQNIAYVPPELADETSYDFEAGSDMYSFGVLVFELLTGDVPFDTPAEAVKANGTPAALPSQLRVGVDITIDSLVTELLRVDNFNARPSATHALAVLRAALNGSAADAEQGLAEDVSPPIRIEGSDGRFAIGAMLNGVMRIDALLGGGAYSQVYKVYHMDQQRTFAMKVLTRPEDADVLLAEYNKIGRYLPRHPNIAQLRWMDRLAPPLGILYILSEYVEGETLEAYCDGRKQLALSDVRDVGVKLLDALSALHGDPITETHASGAAVSRDSARGTEHVFFHRDIKPANVMLELPSGAPKLIDFNISARKDEATGRGGTPRYWAPDRGRPEWRADADLFSLGVVLYELVSQRHPFPDDRTESGEPYDPRITCPDLSISDAFAEFLMKGVQPRGEDRFSSAREMWTALRSIAALHAPSSDDSLANVIGSGTMPGIVLDQAEIGRPNYNPYVTRLLTLYSQARRTNSGTRGLDDIARLTYVRTRLDERLTPAIADGQFRLVIVTGNAGDGKTAYLQRIEEYFRNDLGVSVVRVSGDNGSRWAYGGLAYETNYDGSQDEGDTESDVVLANFLAPFRDAARTDLKGDAVRLIAINEGRLLDFLDHGPDRERFAGLREPIKRALDGTNTPEGLLVINLNVRSVAAGGRQSLVERQLEQLLQNDIWAPCESCALQLRCPLKHNADTMRDATTGRAVRERVRRLFEVVHLRRRAHMTMRDLRSALSWLLLQDNSCEDVATLLTRLDGAPSDQERRTTRNSLVHLSYTAAFMSRSQALQRTVDDRLVALLRESDVGLVDEPRLDRRLAADPNSAVPWMAFDTRSTYPRLLMDKWADDGPHTLEEGPPAEVLDVRRKGMAMWRRQVYFERRDGGWESMLPYRSLGLLERVLQTHTDDERVRAEQEVRDKVVEAISLSEGLRHRETREHYLAIRVSRIKEPTVRSFRLFPREDFSVQVGRGGGRSAEFLEYAPDFVEFVVTKERGVANLRIPLDLLEMLELIRRGYRPSPADLQGLFVNLVIFRNELLNLPFERILLTADDDALYELATTTQNGTIHLALRRLQGTEAIVTIAADVQS